MLGSALALAKINGWRKATSTDSVQTLEKLYFIPITIKINQITFKIIIVISEDVQSGRVLYTANKQTKQLCTAEAAFIYKYFSVLIGNTVFVCKHSLYQ